MACDTTATLPWYARTDQCIRMPNFKTIVWEQNAGKNVPVSLTVKTKKTVPHGVQPDLLTQAKLDSEWIANDQTAWALRTPEYEGTQCL
jgi:hypothetical protein